MGFQIDLQKFSNDLMGLLLNNNIAVKSLMLNMKFDIPELKGVQITWQYYQPDDFITEMPIEKLDVIVLGESLLSFLNRHTLQPVEVGFTLFLPSKHFDYVSMENVDLVENNLIRKTIKSVNNTVLYIQVARQLG